MIWPLVVLGRLRTATCSLTMATLVLGASVGAGAWVVSVGASDEEGVGSTKLGVGSVGSELGSLASFLKHPLNMAAISTAAAAMQIMRVRV